MEYLLYLLFFLLTLVIVSAINHYVRIFKDKDRDSYDRIELLDIRTIFIREFIFIFEANKNMQYGVPAFLLTAFITHGWTLLGGLIGSPHYTNEVGNYFFLSFLLPLLLAVGHPFLFDAFLGDKHLENPYSPPVQFFSQEIPMLMGCSVSMIAANLTVYGMYHEVYFLFILLNIVVVAFLVLYRMNFENFFGLKFPRKQAIEEDRFDEELEV
jgi:hypothetical protein